ncbi:minor tail protein [Mycobacterium phage Hilltopfarm]|nr:minor tail protein [Mycobacterium phage Hilltopfarm]
MPRAVDLRPQNFRLSHDPTHQLTPDAGLGKEFGSAIDLLGKLIGQFPNLIRESAERIVETLIGIATNPIPELVEWVQTIPGWEAIVTALTGIPGGVEQLTQMFTNLRSFLTIDINAEDFDPQQAAQQFVTTVIQPFIKTIAQIRAALLGPLPIGMLTDERITLLLEGGFDDAVTIVEGSGYVHDPDDGATTPLGCAVVECDGQWHLLSTEPVRVAPGWVLKAGAKVKYENVVAAAESNAIRIELTPYNETEQGELVWMASDESPTGTEDWGDLNAWGEYTVPATGVTHVGLTLVTAEEATGGRVKWDNVYLQATQKIPQFFTQDLPEDLLSLWNGLGSLIDQMLTRLGITPVGDLLDRIFDLSDELEWIQQKAQEGAQDAAEALGDIANLAGQLLTNPGAVLGTIGQELVEHLEDDLADAGDAIADVFDDIRETWRNFFNALTGRTEDTTTLDEAAAQMAELAATTAANAALLAQLQAIADGDGNGGVSGDDDFERVNTDDIGPGWDETYSNNTATNGKYTIADGHQAVMVPVGSGTQSGKFLRSLDQPDAETETDFQKVSLVYGTQVAGINAVDRIYGRVSDDGTQYVFAEIGSGNSFPIRLRLGYNVGAGEVITYSGELNVQRSPGQIWALLCGTGANARVFGLSLGGSVIAGWTDTGNVTGMGAGFRRWGWGGASATFFGALKLPSAIARVTIADNTPVPVLGTTFRAYRASTSAITFSLDNASGRLEDVFDSLEYVSSDLVWDPATGTITVAKTGTYLVSGRLAANADVSQSSTIMALDVFVNGSRKIRTGDKLVASGGIGAGSNNDREVAGSVQVYLQAGDQVAMWLYLNNRSSGVSVNFPIAGDAGGVNTWFTVTKVA